jgi:hypothetical protein
MWRSYSSDWWYLFDFLSASVRMHQSQPHGNLATEPTPHQPYRARQGGAGSGGGIPLPQRCYTDPAELKFGAAAGHRCLCKVHRILQYFGELRWLRARCKRPGCGGSAEAKSRRPCAPRRPPAARTARASSNLCPPLLHRHCQLSFARLTVAAPPTPVTS